MTIPNRQYKRNFAGRSLAELHRQDNRKVNCQQLTIVNIYDLPKVRNLERRMGQVLLQLSKFTNASPSATDTDTNHPSSTHSSIRGSAYASPSMAYLQSASCI